MKNTINLLACVSVLSFIAVTIADVAGAPVPAALSFENSIGLYTASLIGLLLVSDYTHRRPTRKTPVAALHTPTASELHRLAA